MLKSIARRAPLIGMGALLMAAYIALAVTAILAQPIPFVIALFCALAVDLVVERQFPALVALSRKAQFGITHRAVVQIFLMLLLVAITDINREMSRLELLGVTAIALLIPGGRIIYMGLLTLVRRRALQPVEARNLDLPPEYDRFQLPRMLDRNASLKLLVLSALPLATGAIAVHGDMFWLFFAACAAYVVVVGGASGYVLGALTELGKRPGRNEILQYVSRKLGEYKPEVVLYFSGAANTRYQIEMWIPTLERMSRRTAIIARGRHVARDLGTTTVPVLSIPSSVDLINFSMPDVRISLYVSNAGPNIHFLREPRVKSVFIGHGDSDKVGSFNPYSRAYDEIWVAGRAGRDRYARARVGVRDSQIVEVGLPPLDDLERRPGHVPEPTSERPLNVLYLPTWEGWSDETFQSSLTEMGAELVEKLLNSKIPIRLLYKPHPLTGMRDKRAKAADDRIRALIAGSGQPPVDQQSAERLEAIAARLETSNGMPPEEKRALKAEWGEVYWKANAKRHVVVEGRMPPLYDLYNASDLMISDVSSVVSDYMATGKPYIVANPKGYDDEAFREEFPSVRAAYLLHPHGSDLEAILGQILDADPMADARARERAYLLGPDYPAAQVRWDEAVEALIATAEEEWDGEHGAGPSVAPVEVVEAAEGTLEPGESINGADPGDAADTDLNGAMADSEDAEEAAR